MRAIHTRWDRPVLIDDAWGDRLVTDEEREALTKAAMELLVISSSSSSTIPPRKR